MRAKSKLEVHIQPRFQFKKRPWERGWFTFEAKLMHVCSELCLNKFCPAYD